MAVFKEKIIARVKWSICFILIYCGRAAAEGVSYIETWECKDSVNYWSEASEILVVAGVMMLGETGELTVAGRKYIASYSVNGFSRRWDFPLIKDAKSFDYAFIIEPNGNAYYYDFTDGSDKVKPKILMKCQERKK